MPVWAAGHAVAGLLVVGVVVGLALPALGAAAVRAHRQDRSRWPCRCWPIVGLPLVGWAAGRRADATGVPGSWRFKFDGGVSATPEFIALLLGLVLYTAAFIAEMVRARHPVGAAGQCEAAGALGLSRGQTMRLVVLPQALRVIIPPMTSQYLNLTKNSSLAVAIGYPDMVSIANTTLNQTGRAVEGIAIIMLVYLTISLSTSPFMNWYNKRVGDQGALMELP